ncbi:MAG: LLM class flavin-dependent oxidoreductase [Campylobacteraceae bacterium]|jgi:FMN-dependent oxidoreductase (nitrilotriacetate monooxygenase family)|nr:LLM class flavin-dependent oxidoreductase [Campylobacteraceae bacterium]
MSKKIFFNAFEMNCVGHQSPGLWAHPRDRSWQYKDLEYWTDLAKTLEEGFFTAIFIADVVGYYDVYNDDAKAAVKNGVQIPVNDPLQIAGPVAQATKHIGIGITSSTSFEHPYTWARRIATADHYTKGRVGWNIVTSYLESGARNVGDNGLNRHDNRYEVAEEYLEVIYKLLEGSWEEGAVVRDREKRIFADPDKVHEIGHKGKYFEVPGIGLTEPSPQRTPVLFQAGSSEAGKNFAAGHAELVFVSTPSKKVVKEYIADIRKKAAENGRDPKKVLVLALITIIVDETDEKAKAKHEEYKKYVSYDGALSLVSGWSGIDFGKYKPDEPIKKEDTNAIISVVEHLTNGEKDWTPNDLAGWVGIGGMGPLFVGSAKTVADQLQEWVEYTDVDGFNIAYAVSHETFADVVKYLVPELQKRGVYPTSYKEGTLREKVFGYKYLPENHPAARYRDIEKIKKEEAKKN